MIVRLELDFAVVKGDLDKNILNLSKTISSFRSVISYRFKFRLHLNLDLDFPFDDNTKKTNLIVHEIVKT